MKDRIIKEPGNKKDEFHKGDRYNVSRKIKGIIKHVQYNFKHDVTEVRVCVQ